MRSRAGTRGRNFGEAGWTPGVRQQSMVKPPVSDDRVKGATGRDWAEWRRVLDAAGARKMSHAEIARMVHDRFAGGDPSTSSGSVPPHNAGWWSQMVTVGYERP